MVVCMRSNNKIAPFTGKGCDRALAEDSQTISRQPTSTDAKSSNEDNGSDGGPEEVREQLTRSMGHYSPSASIVLIDINK